MFPKNLAQALAKAQGELKNPTFDSVNPHYKSEYVSLAKLRDTVTPVLVKNGLGIIQLPLNKEGLVGCKTILFHVEGECIESEFYIPVQRQDAHSVGSALTYARRYSLLAVLGLAGEEDDDGNSALPSATAGNAKANVQKASAPVSYKSLLLKKFNTPAEAKEWVLSVTGKEQITETEAKQLLEQNFQED